MRKLLYASVLTVLTMGTAHAGPQYIDRTGYAAGGYDVVAYFEMNQVPVGQKQPAAVPGKAGITAEHNGAQWAFSSEENREKFLADPAKYTPAYDGHCAYGVAQGAKVPGNPNLWRIVDGKLYLNITPGVASRWEKDIDGWLVKSEKNWQTKEGEAASTSSWRAIKGNKGTFSGPAPVEG